MNHHHRDRQHSTYKRLETDDEYRARLVEVGAASYSAVRYKGGAELDTFGDNLKPMRQRKFVMDTTDKKPA